MSAEEDAGAERVEPQPPWARPIITATFGTSSSCGLGETDSVALEGEALVTPPTPQPEESAPEPEMQPPALAISEVPELLEAQSPRSVLREASLPQSLPSSAPRRPRGCLLRAGGTLDSFCSLLPTPSFDAVDSGTRAGHVAPSTSTSEVHGFRSNNFGSEYAPESVLSCDPFSPDTVAKLVGKAFAELAPGFAASVAARCSQLVAEIAAVPVTSSAQHSRHVERPRAARRKMSERPASGDLLKSSKSLPLAAKLTRWVSTPAVPTVESLECEFAEACLERSGFGVASRRSRSNLFESPVSPCTSRGPEGIPGTSSHVMPEPSPSIGCSEAQASIAWAAQAAPRPMIHAATAFASSHSPAEDDLEVRPMRWSATQPPIRRRDSPGGTQRWNAETAKFRRTVTEVMKVRVLDLAREATESEYVHDSRSRSQSPMAAPTLEPHRRAVPLGLLVLGVLPWEHPRCPRLCANYRYVARTIIVLAGAAFLAHLFHDIPTRQWDGSNHTVLSQIPLPIGVVLGIATFGFAHRAERLQETFTLLSMVADDRGFRDRYLRLMRWPGVMYVLLWLCSVGAICWDMSRMITHRHGREVDAVAHVVLFSMFSGAILCMSFGMACVCRSLNALIDKFCCDAIECIPMSEIAHTWNVTQAVIRKASHSVEQCLLALGMILSIALPLTICDLVALAPSGRISALPSFFVACGVLYVVLMAATVSEKCTRVPALVNAVSFGEGTDRSRQEVVDYIVSSAAGFYVFGVRLTTTMVIKFCYGWTVIAVGLTTKSFGS